MKLLLRGALLLASIVASAGSEAQTFGDQTGSKYYIVYSAEAQTVAAGKTGRLELHFHVQEGFHVNSHTPKSEYLLPTKLDFAPAAGVKVEAFEYPAGTPYSFSFEPDEKLDVYTGLFTVKMPVVATAGEHRLSGTLRYQACDHAACYPPKTLPLEVLFTAK